MRRTKLYMQANKDDTDPDYDMHLKSLEGHNNGLTSFGENSGNGLKSLRENNNGISEAIELEYDNGGYDTDPDYRMYLKSLGEDSSGGLKSFEENNNNGLKSLSENSNWVSENMEWEYDNGGYDTDPDYRMYLESLRGNSNEISESMEREDANGEDDIDHDISIHLKSTREKTNEISEPVEYDLVESNKERPINNKEKLPLGLNGQCQDSLLDGTEKDRNEISEAIEYELVEPKKEERDGEWSSDTEILVLNDALDYGGLKSFEENNNNGLKSLSENSNWVSENMEWEYDNGGYDTDPDYRMYLESLRGNSNEISESMEREDANGEDDIDHDISIHLKSTREKTNEISEPVEYDLVESNKERLINNEEKLPLGLNGQCQDSLLDGTEKDRNEISEATEYELVEPKKEERDGEWSSDTEVLVLNDALDYGEGNLSSFVSSKVYHAPLDSEKGGNSKCSNNTDDESRSKFRDEVMAVYKKCYDEGELDELLEQVKLHKPVTGWINLRGRSASYPTDRSSKSYLDHYPDLKTELDRVSLDRPKMLNTLRGFFYWLKNISREGAFKPWLDPLCQAVTPGVL